MRITPGFSCAGLLPDSTRLVIGETALQPGSFAASIVSTLTGKRSELDSNYSGHRVSPDGLHIAAVRGHDEGDEIWLFDAYGLEARKVVSAQESQIKQLEWSPDGRRISYLRWHLRAPKGQVSIESCDLAGEDVQEIINDWRLNSPDGLAPVYVWAADGRVLVCLADTASTGTSTRESNLWELDVDMETGVASGPLRRVTEWTGIGCISPTLTSDGKQLAYVRIERNTDVVVGELRITGGPLMNQQRLTFDGRDDFPAAWLSDNQTLLFDSDRNGNWDIFRKRLDADTVDMLVFSPANERDAQLTPGGSSILYWWFDGQGAAEGAVRLMEKSITGGSPRVVLSTDSRRTVKCASVSGKTCLLSVREDRQIIFSRLDLTSGETHEIARTDISLGEYDWDISPDGEQIAIVEFVGRVRTLTLSTKETREINPGYGEGFQSVAWHPRGDALFATGMIPTYFLLRLDLNGSAEVIFEGAGRWLYQPVPSPDGRYVAFAAMSWNKDVWMLEGF
jgi:Tol biopolymer transport system component